MINKKYILLLPVLTLLYTACQQNGVYEDYKSIDGEKWCRENDDPEKRAEVKAKIQLEIDRLIPTMKWRTYVALFPHAACLPKN